MKDEYYVGAITIIATATVLVVSAITIGVNSYKAAEIRADVCHDIMKYADTSAQLVSITEGRCK